VIVWTLQDVLAPVRERLKRAEIPTYEVARRIYREAQRKGWRRGEDWPFLDTSACPDTLTGSRIPRNRQTGDTMVDSLQDRIVACVEADLLFRRLDEQPGNCAGVMHTVVGCLDDEIRRATPVGQQLRAVRGVFGSCDYRKAARAGTRMLHAWVEIDLALPADPGFAWFGDVEVILCVDFSNGTRNILNKEVYYAIGNCIPLDVYTNDQLEALREEHRTYGPYAQHKYRKLLARNNQVKRK
jgi:hypothetical protein